MPELAEKAVLIRLSLSQWTARKYDKRVSQEVAGNYGINIDLGRYNKVLVDSNEIKKITKVVNSTRTFFYANTLPWSAESRIRPTQGYLDFMSQLSVYKSENDRVVQDFCLKYETLREQARRDLKNMFNPADYPPVGAIHRKFGFHVEVTPLPSSEDFRVNLSNEEVARMREALEMQTKRAVQQAMKTAWERLHEAVSHMASKLTIEKQIFRDTLVENLEELVRVLPVLNIADDPELTKMCHEVSYKLCSYDAQVLRNDDGARKETGIFATKLAEEISTKISEVKEPQEYDLLDSIIAGL
jgi:hypothetical protein